MTNYSTSDMNPIYVFRRKGTSKDPYIFITETLKIDIAGKTILKEIPSEFERVTALNSANVPLVEAQGDINLGTNSFYVDYRLGKVTVANGNIGENITFTYMGTGATSIGSSRIYVEDDGSKPTRTLKDLIENLKTIISSNGLYVHPASHSPSIIAQDANNRFVTDAEKTKWNNGSDDVSVKKFGAKGDGVTDDTVAIQSVIDSLENGGVILFPEGTYLVSSSLIINKSNVILKGIHQKLVEIKDHPSMTTSVPILLITGVNKTNRIENVTIEGIKFRNGSAVTGNYVDGKDGIKVIFANNITIKHCMITEIQGEAGVTVRFCRNINFLNNYVFRCTYAGFDALNECEDIRVLDNEFDTLTSTTTANTYAIVTGYDLDYGISAFPIKNLWIERNIVRNNPRWEGIDSHGGQNIWIRDNYVENCKTGIMVSSAESAYFTDITTKNVVIENNVLIRGNGQTGHHGLYVGGNREMFIENVVIKGNEVTGFGYNDKGCLVIEYSINAEVAHNTIDQYRYNGIGITGWNNDIKVHDNLIKNKDVSVSAPAVGINAIYVYQSGNVGVSIENNKSYPNSNAQAPTNVVHAYSVSNVTAFGNKFKGSSTLYKGKVLSGFTSYNLDNISLYYLRKGDIVYDTNENPMYRVTSPETGHAGNRPLYSAIFSGTVGTNILTLNTLTIGTVGSYGLGCNITIPLSGGGTFKALVKSWTEYSLLLDRNLPENIVSQSVTIDVATFEIISLDEALADFSINVRKFGAIGDGVTDDSASIEQAIAYCLNMEQEGKKPVLFFPTSSGFATSKTITVPPNIGIDMHSSLIYTGQLDEPCLVIGETDTVTTTVYRLNVDRQNQADWENEDNIGIKFYNATTSDIYIEYVNGFTIGVQCIGSGGTGFVYSTVKLGDIVNGKVGIELTTETDGWTNENLFLGGRIHVDSNIHPTKNRYGIRMSSIDLTYAGSNNNVFQKPSIEIGELGVDAVAVLIEHGMQNYFYDARTEGDYTCAMRTLNRSTRNYMTVGYGEFNIEQEGIAGDNFVELNYEPSTRISSIYQFNDLHKKANHYSDTEIYISGFDFDWGGAQYQISNIGIFPNYLELPTSRKIRKQVDTTSRKRFVVAPVALQGYGGRVDVKCYGVNDVLLVDNAEGSIRYCKGTTNRPMSWITGSQTYATGSDSNAPIYFMVSDEVKRIEIQLMGGVNPLRLQGFSITSLDGATRVYSLLPEKNVGQGLAIKAPTLGTYDKGKVLFNNNPNEITDENGSIYVVTSWTCTNGGTLGGTWVENRAYKTIASLMMDYEIHGKALSGGILDNHAVLTALITKARTTGKGLYIPNGRYYVSENLEIQGIRNVIIEGDIIMAPNKMFELVYNNASTNGLKWDINSVEGKVRISGVKNGIVKIQKATILELYANGDDSLREAVAYSQFHLGNIDTFRMVSEGVLEGWINENAFWGGRIDNLFIDGNYTHNNNTFYKFMMEGGAVNIVNGNSNRFYDCRFEGTNTFSFGVKSFDNTFMASWESGKGYSLRNANDLFNVTDLGVNNRVVFADDGFMEKTVIYKLDANSKNFPLNVLVKNQHDLTPTGTWKRLFASGLIKVNSDMGLHFNCDQSQFRTFYHFFDANKQLITIPLSEHLSYDSGHVWEVDWESSLFGLSKDTSNHASSGIGIFKNTPIKYVQMVVVIGSVAKTFEHFEMFIRTNKRQSLVIAPLEKKYTVCTNPTMPTTGYWRIGDIVYHSAPAVGQPIGWICIAEGTSGTWRTFGTNG